MEFFRVAGVHSVQSKTKGYFPFFTQRHQRKKFMFSHRSRTYDHPVTTPDCLPLSYKRMAGYSVIFECNTDKMIIGEYNFLYNIFFFFGSKNTPSIDHWLNTLRISRKYLTKLYIFKFRDHFVELHLQKNSK